jgi:hypothetical protein
MILNKFVPVLCLIMVSMPIIAAEKSPIGPELAPMEVGRLVKAYPMLTQNNAMAPGGIGVILWGCDYSVGRALITITVTTSTSDPMPCKRKVVFGNPN